MPAVVRSTESQKIVPTEKLKIGLANAIVSKESDNKPVLATLSQTRRPNTFTRRSIDTARSYSRRRKQRPDRSGVADISFFEPDAILIASTDENSNPIPTIENMKVTDGNTSLRPPVRMDAQDGPWSVSVAETPHDARSYSLYIKSESIHLPTPSASACLRTRILSVSLHLLLRRVTNI